MKKYIIYSNSIQHLKILQKAIPRVGNYCCISTDDMGILEDSLKNSKDKPLYLILDFEYESIKKIREFAYNCINLREDIKCILLPANYFPIVNQKIELVHFVQKGKIVNTFSELVKESKQAR